MTKTQATTRAAACVKRLGPGWKPVVWENLGWHFKATSCDGRFKVHYHEGDKTYTSLLSLDEGASGDMHLTDDFSHTDPRQVVIHQMEALRAHIRKHQELEHAILMEIRF